MSEIRRNKIYGYMQSLSGFISIHFRVGAAALVFFLSSPNGTVFPEPSPAEKIKIEKLITAVELSGYIFIRNGREHSSKEAADHMRLKFSRTEKYIQTAEDFIEHAGTRSSMTGQPYRIKISGKSGSMPLSVWLRSELKKMGP